MTYRLSFNSQLLIGVSALFFANEVLAASSDAPRQPVAGAAIFIAFAIAYLSRRRAIGGWLLYFYIQLYVSLAFSLFFSSQILSNLNPNQWDDSFLYVMFFLSVVPVLVTEIIEGIVATMLLIRRNEKNLDYLQKILSALVATSAIALVIDVSYFREFQTLFLDIFIFIFAVIWKFYFLKAPRIRSVFIERNWAYVSYSKRRALTLEDKKILRKRSLISALVTFVLFLLMMGYVLKNEGKQPDTGLFVVPLFYAFVAAVIAWYSPLRKKKTGSS